jgi:hypothetical protein
MDVWLLLREEHSTYIAWSCKVDMVITETVREAAGMSEF